MLQSSKIGVQLVCKLFVNNEVFMQNLYYEFDKMVGQVMEVKDLSFTLTSAMKGCIADSAEAYSLLPAMEILSNKTNTLYEKAEEFSTKMLQQDLCADHDSM